MKKILLAMLLTALSFHAFAETLVYTGFFGTTSYTMSNNGNFKGNPVYRAFFVVSYDPTTKVFSDAAIITFWKSDGQKWRQTTAYSGNINENLFISPEGNRVSMKLFLGDDTTSNFQFSDSPVKMMSNKRTIIGSEMLFAASLQGAQIYESVENGARVIRSVKIKFSIASQWTKDHINGSAATAITDIEGTLNGWGYRLLQ